MAEGTDETRRRFIKGSLGVATGLALAGCTGDSGGESTETTTETTSAETTADGTTTDETTTEDASGESYTVSMVPVGDVTFESVPEKWETYFPGYADMGVALGQADGLSAVGSKSRFYTSYYDELDGVSLDKGSVVELVGDNGIDKEVYYELDNDVHLTDPKWLVSNSFFGLQQKDVDQIVEQVGPFVGNTIFRRTDKWHDYRYYTMYEAFEKVAEVFQKKDQYEAFKSFHDSYLADVKGNLPAAKQRPNGLLCFAASDEPEKFSPYRIDGKGANKKHFHDLGVSDALEGTDVQGLSESNRGKIDYETLLQVDPDALFVRGHETKTREEFQNTVVSFMKDHNVASQLTAVENDDVYRGGPIYQGPIQNLFLTERFATLLYPDTFSGELFDRGKLSNIVAGEF
ncbi:ABC transporter substrate-binding protein [Halorussus caseinilyticus]|uniref:ABC transporter substrate-binding protein n=1 Tax=Halorussus caseinilyticus TaxID=3034025 RepID=A0ABD5WEK6_9EURY|nr:ABC transporter substrate-binding protein [Halorussus sp. DT72]